MAAALALTLIIGAILVVTTQRRVAINFGEPGTELSSVDQIYRGNGMELELTQFDITSELPGEDEEVPFYRPPQGSRFAVVEVRQKVVDPAQLGDCTLALGHGERRWEQGVDFGHPVLEVSTPLEFEESQCLESWGEAPRAGQTRTFGLILLVPAAEAEQVRPVITIQPAFEADAALVPRPELVWL